MQEYTSGASETVLCILCAYTGYVIPLLVFHTQTQFDISVASEVTVTTSLARHERETVCVCVCVCLCVCVCVCEQLVCILYVYYDSMLLNIIVWCSNFC